ncbi:MAG: hypothetical protein R3E60_06930 [Alphaproteobacteria bacterium]
MSQGNVKEIADKLLAGAEVWAKEYFSGEPDEAAVTVLAALSTDIAIQTGKEALLRELHAIALVLSFTSAAAKEAEPKVAAGVLALRCVAEEHRKFFGADASIRALSSLLYATAIVAGNATTADLFETIAARVRAGQSPDQPIH